MEETRMSISKFMNAIDTVTKWVIGSNNDGDHWGTITWREADVGVKRKGKRAKAKSKHIIVKSREIQ